MGFDARVIRSLPLLDGVPEAAADAVLAAAVERTFDAGSTVFAQGARATACFVILSGSVKLVQLTEDGDAVVFRLLVPGDVFGTVAILGEKTYPVSASAVTAVRTLEWPAATMRHLLGEYPRLALNVLRSVSDRLQSLRAQYRQLATERVERRLARALLRLARAGTHVAEGLLLDLPLSREDMAQLTGTTVFTVSRIISRWESSGFVRAGRQQLIIRELHSLAAIAGDHP
jgi:CRP-like cAMP-binding protein